MHTKVKVTLKLLAVSALIAMLPFANSFACPCNSGADEDVAIQAAQKQKTQQIRHVRTYESPSYKHATTNTSYTEEGPIHPQSITTNVPVGSEYDSASTSSDSAPYNNYPN